MEQWSDETNVTEGADNIAPLLQRSSIPLLRRCFLRMPVLKLGGGRAPTPAYGRQNLTTGNKEHDRRARFRRAA